MMGTRLNIENCARVGHRSDKDWCLEELVRNLKELRDRTDRGDMAALQEFFAIFVFDDDQHRRSSRRAAQCDAIASPANQCDGCMQGAEIRNGLHVDRCGKAFMACERAKYTTQPA